MIIQDVIDFLLRKKEGSIAPIENTIDTLKAGYPTAEVKGIAVTMMATYKVIQTAIEKGANLLITHEPTFYNHADHEDNLKNDPVFFEKKRLIDESNLAIFRFHDYAHSYKPDVISQGVIEAIGWEKYLVDKEKYASSSCPIPFSVPELSVGEIADLFKDTFKIPFVRVIGDPDLPCKRVGFLPGYGGSSGFAIPFFQQEDLELIITGEGPEWETVEYVRDAIEQGKQKALIILGHIKSEEAGMELISKKLQVSFPEVPTIFIPENQPFTVR